MKEWSMKKLWPSTLLWIAFFFWPCAMLAQTPTGTILGTADDGRGGVIPGAKITITEVQTGVARSTVSNNLGYFEMPFLPPGQYQLTAEQTGFKRFVRAGLVLNTDQKMEIPVSLQPGQVQQVVEVTGAAPLLETTASAVGQVIENRSVVDLPLSNRNLLQLTGLVAGVLDRGADAAPATTGSVAFGHWSANGGMTNTNAFMLDGATAQLANMNAASIIPTIDSIDEFKIQTSTMSAEYGRTGGAVINVNTKSGTNSLHGTVYEFWKNRVLNANTWINNHSNQPTAFTNINTFGYSLGGPVVIPKLIDGRNRLFFFTNYEGYRDVNPVSTLLTVPTVAERNGDFSQLRTQGGAPINIYDPTTTALAPGSTTQYTRQQFSYNGVANVIPPGRIDPTAAAMMAYYPLPNTTPTNTNTQINNFFTDGAGYDSQNQWSVRVDDNLTSTKRLFVRYAQSAQGGGAANYFPDTMGCSECLVHGNPAGAFSPRGGGSALYVYPKNAVVGYTQTLSAKTVLDLRFSLNRQFLQRLPQSGGFDLTSIGLPAGVSWYPVFPPTTIANYYGLGTPSNGDYLRRGDTTVATQGSVTLLHGGHTIKVGGDFRVFRYNDLQAYNISPTFTFDQVWTQQNPFSSSATAGWSLASFLVGTPASGTVSIPSSVSVQWFYTAGYIQDDWRVFNRLTLNLGLRYNLETPFTERHNRSSTFSPTGNTILTDAYSGAVGGLIFMGKDISSRYQAPIDFTSFAPRIGVAFKASDAFVWRGAYGIFYAPFNSYGYPAVSNGVVSSAFGANGYGSNTSMVTTNDGGLTPANYIHNPFPQGLLQPTGNSLGLLTAVGQVVNTTLRNNVVVPYIQQYSAGFEYQVRSYLFGLDYVGSHSVHQIVNAPLDQLPVADYQLGNSLNDQLPNPFYGLITNGTLSTPKISRGQLLRPFPQFQDVQDQYQSTGSLHYNSLQARVEHRFANGFSLFANYTWSKNIGDTAERYWSPRSVQNQYDPAAEEALVPFDTPQALGAAWTWELPFGRNKPFAGALPGYANVFVSGWQLNGDYTFNSGNPLAVTNSVNQLGFGAGSRPNNNGKSPILSGSKRSTAEWFDTSVYSVPAPYHFGNEPAYDFALRGPHTNVWNISLFKDTSITERMRLQLRGEFYNTFNHPIWAAPGTSVGTPAFGVVSQKTGNRTGQLGAKIIF